MARQSNLNEKLIFTSSSFDPVLALQSKELAKRCSKARPFDNLRQYVNGLQHSTSFKSLGWFPEEFGPQHRSDKRPSKRKASALLDNRDAASKDSSCSEIDEGKTQRTKQVKLSNSAKDSKRDKPVLSSDGSFKSLFQPSSDDTSVCSDQDFQYIKEALHGDKQKCYIKEPSTDEVTKNTNVSILQNRLKSLATSDAKSLKRASKVDKISRFQNVMIEKIEEQKITKKGRSHGNVLQKMEVYQNGPLSVLYNCMNKGIRVKVWTRRYKGLRGVCTGYLIAFDKHMNLAMIDVDEVYTLEIRTLSQVEQEEIAKKKRAEKRNRNRLNRIKRNCEFIEKHENAAEEKIFRGSVGSTNQQISEPSSQQHVLTAKTESYSLGIVPNKTQLIVKDEGVSNEARSFLKRKDHDVAARKTASVGKKVEQNNVIPEKPPPTLLHDKQTKIDATKISNIDNNDRKTGDNLKSEFSKSLTVDDALATKFVTTKDSDNLATSSSSCKSGFGERKCQVEVKVTKVLDSRGLDFDISESSEDEAENDDIAKRRISESDGENKKEETASSLSGVYALKVVSKSQNVEKSSISDPAGKSVALNIGELKQNNRPEKKFIEQEPKRRIRCHFSLFSSLANPHKEKNDRHDLSPSSGPKFAKNPEDLTLERKTNVHNDEMIQTSSTVVDVENNTSKETVSNVLEIASHKETKAKESVVAQDVKPKPTVSCHEDPNFRRKSVNVEHRSEGGSNYRAEALKQSLVSKLEENIKDAASRDTKSSSGSLSCPDKDSLNERRQADVTNNVSEVVCKEDLFHRTDEVNDFNNFHLVKLELTPRIAYSDMERCKFSSTEESDAILDAARDPRLQKMKDPKTNKTDQTEHNKIDFKSQADFIIADHDRSSDKRNENIHYSLSDSKDKQTLSDLASETHKQKQKQLDPRLRIGKARLSNSNTSSATQKQVECDILSPTEECDKQNLFSSSAAANLTSNLPDEKLWAIGDIAEKGQEQETKSKMGLPSFSLSQKPKQTDPRLGHRRRHSSYLPQRTQEPNNCGVLSSSGVSDDNDSPFHPSADSDEGVTAQRGHSISKRSHSGGFRCDEAANINSAAEVSGSKSDTASTDSTDRFDAKFTLADMKLDYRENNKTKSRTTPKEHNPACYSEETEPCSSIERNLIAAREINSTDDLQFLLSKNPTEMAKQSLGRQDNKNNDQNNSENTPHESISKSALARFFQRRRPVLDNQKPHADNSIVLQNKPGFAKTSLLEAKETIFKRECLGANQRTLPTISAVFDPKKPVAGHIFKERHVHQIFIRGDNVAMVAYDKK